MYRMQSSPPVRAFPRRGSQPESEYSLDLNALDLDNDDTDTNIPKPNIGSGPPVVVVTVIDPKADPVWMQKIKSNREEYAKRHGTS